MRSERTNGGIIAIFFSMCLHFFTRRQPEMQNAVKCQFLNSAVIVNSLQLPIFVKIPYQTLFQAAKTPRQPENSHKRNKHGKKIFWHRRHSWRSRSISDYARFCAQTRQRVWQRIGETRRGAQTHRHHRQRHAHFRLYAGNRAGGRLHRRRGKRGANRAAAHARHRLFNPRPALGRRRDDFRLAQCV